MLNNISDIADIFFNAARGSTVNVSSATNMRTTEKTATATKQSRLWMVSRNSHGQAIGAARSRRWSARTNRAGSQALAYHLALNINRFAFSSPPSPPPGLSPTLNPKT